LIIVKISGGLGNQLFQYATARSLSLELNRKLFLDTSWYGEIFTLEDNNHPNATTIRNFQLNKFNIVSPIKSKLYINWIKRLEIRSKKSMFFKLLKSGPLNTLSFSKFDTKKYSFDILKQVPRVYLTGYWQNNDIIEKYNNTLKDELKLIEPLSENNKKYLKKVNCNNSVAIHIRRGDYITKPNSSKLHSTCSENYYKNAINSIEQSIEQPQYFVFSDEIDWVKTNMELPSTTIFVDTDGAPYEHMYLMSQCKHQITANSTFSWWAAWLNNYQDKMIITPKYWYYDKTLNNTIIRIPNSWIKIDNLN